MTRRRASIGIPTGPAPTLHVVNMGQRLAVLDGMTGTENLIQKLCDDDHSASAELTGIFLLKSGKPDALCDLEPEIIVSDRRPRPDFRISVPGCDWAYVEVKQTSTSEEQEEANNILAMTVTEAIKVKKSFSVEIFLRRSPSAEELDQIKARLPDFCNRDGVHREDLGELGILFLNLDPPGTINLRDHGEEYRPKICMTRGIYGPDEPHRQASVRLAFSDERVHRFLEVAASQLPTYAPTLIMVQVAKAPGAFKGWEPVIRKRFQHFHARVSAICLIQSGFESTPAGHVWIPRTKLISNPNAKHPLPKWIEQQLARFPSDHISPVAAFSMVEFTHQPDA